jgi:hypothetical protein
MAATHSISPASCEYHFVYLVPGVVPLLVEPGGLDAPPPVLGDIPEPLTVPLVDEPLVAPVEPASVLAPELPVTPAEEPVELEPVPAAAPALPPDAPPDPPPELPPA